LEFGIWNLECASPELFRLNATFHIDYLPG